jgi:hypothetical protein
VTEQRRRRLGIAGVTLGTLLLAVGVAINHFTGLPDVDSVGRPIYDWIPRCAPFENDPARCWVLPYTGMGIALLGSQIAMAAIWFGWIYERTLTWALATLAAFLFTLEMLILLGMVPNQWLNLAQGTLEWSGQRTALTIPKWLVLNNNVEISYGVLKDVISGGWSATVLGGVAVTAYQLQERAKRKGQPAQPTSSPYGRPVVKGSR